MTGSARKMLLSTSLLAVLAMVTLASPAAAAVKLPALFTDHMVIQRDAPIRVWGWASPGEPVTVTLGGREASAKAAADGRWSASFAPLAASGIPVELKAVGSLGSAAVVVRDILVGDIWVCSGQSNMEWTLGQTFTATPEVLRADRPRIRLFHVPWNPSMAPVEDVEAKWDVCTPESASRFSAVGYYFGSEIERTQDVPVGMIMSTWGGTYIEPWTPAAAFALFDETKPLLAAVEPKMAEYREALAKAMPAVDAWAKTAHAALKRGGAVPQVPGLPPHPFDNPQTPTALFNGMIAPLTSFPIRGAIWYQGENNVGDGFAYRTKMEAMIRGWRGAWSQPDLPFYYVQIAPFRYGYEWRIQGGDVRDTEHLPQIWEAQTAALEIPGTGMAVISDITDLDDIHPRNKIEVGRRLALWARAKTYGEAGLVYSGPLFKSMTVEGGAARLTFDHVGGGLIANDAEPLRWFEVAGDDRVFHKAEATIDGATVVVRNPKVPAPKAVRFGWDQAAVPNLANKEGLPASPFRTDRW